LKHHADISENLQLQVTTGISCNPASAHLLLFIEHIHTVHWIHYVTRIL
jgi:hypothetical protein